MALLLEVRANGLCAVRCAAQIDLNDMVPVARAAVDNAAVGCGTGTEKTFVSIQLCSRRKRSIEGLLGNEGINLAEIRDHLVNELLDVLVVALVDLVHLDLDAVCLGQLSRVLLGALFTRRVGDGKISAHLGTASRGFDSHAPRAGSPGHNDNLALQAEEVKKTVGFGDGLRHGGQDDVDVC